MEEGFSSSIRKTASASATDGSPLGEVTEDQGWTSEGEWGFPEIHWLFAYYNATYFDGALGSVEVKWSKRMTLCAGLCVYQRGGYCSIRLSEPLLKYRTVKELKETLLHEMIHAYLFVSQSRRDRDAHGPEFRYHMERINSAGKFNITIYHTFKDEVEYYKRHIWRCLGACRNKAPYFGYVRRAMNRPPGPSDFWHEQHKLECGGTFVKVSEPHKINKKDGGNTACNRSKSLKHYFEKKPVVRKQSDPSKKAGNDKGNLVADDLKNNSTSIGYRKSLPTDNVIDLTSSTDDEQHFVEELDLNDT